MFFHCCIWLANNRYISDEIAASIVIIFFLNSNTGVLIKLTKNVIGDILNKSWLPDFRAVNCVVFFFFGFLDEW